MAILKRIFIIHRTSSQHTDAGSKAQFDLNASTKGTDFNMAFPDNPKINERELGRTDEYEFDVEGKNVKRNTELTMIMKTTNDGWLPDRIWAFGETVDNEMIVLGAHPVWEGGWFDRGDDATAGSSDRHIISGGLAHFGLSKEKRSTQ